MAFGFEHVVLYMSVIVRYLANAPRAVSDATWSWLAQKTMPTYYIEHAAKRPSPFPLTDAIVATFLELSSPTTSREAYLTWKESRYAREESIEPYWRTTTATVSKALVTPSTNRQPGTETETVLLSSSSTLIATPELIQTAPSTSVTGFDHATLPLPPSANGIICFGHELSELQVCMLVGVLMALPTLLRLFVDGITKIWSIWRPPVAIATAQPTQPPPVANQVILATAPSSTTTASQTPLLPAIFWVPPYPIWDFRFIVAQLYRFRHYFDPANWSPLCRRSLHCLVWGICFTVIMAFGLLTSFFWAIFIIFSYSVAYAGTHCQEWYLARPSCDVMTNIFLGHMVDPLQLYSSSNWPRTRLAFAAFFGFYDFNRLQDTRVQQNTFTTPYTPGNTPPQVLDQAPTAKELELLAKLEAMRDKCLSLRNEKVQLTNEMEEQKASSAVYRFTAQRRYEDLYKNYKFLEGNWRCDKEKAQKHVEAAAASEKAHEALRQQLSELKNAVEVERLEKQEFDKRHNELKDSLQRSEARAEQLNGDVSAKIDPIKKRADEAESHATAATQARRLAEEKLEQVIEQGTSMVAELRKQVETLTLEKDKLTSEKVELSFEKERLGSEKETLQSVTQKLQFDMNQLMRDNNNAQAENARLIGLGNKIQDELAHATSKAKENDEKMRQLQVQNAELLKMVQNRPASSPGLNTSTGSGLLSSRFAPPQPPHVAPSSLSKGNNPGLNIPVPFSHGTMDHSWKAKIVREPDPRGAYTAAYMSISMMDEYNKFSHEELRLADYNKFGSRSREDDDNVVMNDIPPEDMAEQQNFQEALQMTGLEDIQQFNQDPSWGTITQPAVHPFAQAFTQNTDFPAFQQSQSFQTSLMPPPPVPSRVIPGLGIFNFLQNNNLSPQAQTESILAAVPPSASSIEAARPVELAKLLAEKAAWHQEHKAHQAQTRENVKAARQAWERGASPAKASSEVMEQREIKPLPPPKPKLVLKFNPQSVAADQITVQAHPATVFCPSACPEETGKINFVEPVPGNHLSATGASLQPTLSKAPPTDEFGNVIIPAFVPNASSFIIPTTTTAPAENSNAMPPSPPASPSPKPTLPFAPSKVTKILVPTPQSKIISPNPKPKPGYLSFTPSTIPKLKHDAGAYKMKPSPLAQSLSANASIPRPPSNLSTPLRIRDFIGNDSGDESEDGID